jgi:hypothetical protein
VARKPRTDTDPPEEDTDAIMAIGKGSFMTLFRKVNAARREMDAEKSSIAGMISDAVENKRLHKKAFAWCRMVSKMVPSKRSEFLFNIDLYRSWFPEWDKQLDMFRAGGAEEEVGGEDDGDEDAEAAADAQWGPRSVA